MRSLALTGVILLLAGLGWWLLADDGPGPSGRTGDLAAAGDPEDGRRAAQAPGTEADPTLLSADRVALPDQPIATLGDPTADPRPGPFQVRVTSALDGAAVAAARCLLRERWGDQELAAATTDAEGLATLGGLVPDQEYELAVEALGFVLETRPVPPGSTRADVVLKAGFPLQGQVTDASTGLPVAGARVQVRDGWSRHAIGQARTTDESGAFRHPGIPPRQPVEITVAKAGYVALVEQRSWEQEPPLLRFVLGQGATLTGNVREPDGRGVEGAQVLVEQAGGMDGPAKVAVQSGADGAFRLVGLPVASYQLVARLESGRSGRSGIFRILSPDDRVQVDVSLAGPETGLRILVLDQRGEGRGDLALNVLDEHTSDIRRGRTDETGTCIVAPLDPGAYMVRLALEDRPLEIHPATVKEGRLEEVRILVREGATLQGSVIDAEGRPVEGQEVAFWFEVPHERRDVISLVPDFAPQDSAWNHASTRSGADGGFHLRGLPAQAGVLRVGDVDGFEGDEFVARWSSVELFGVVPGPDPVQVVLPAAARVIARLVPAPSVLTALCQVSIGSAGWYHEVPVSKEGDLELAFTRASRSLDLLIDPHDGAAWFFPGLTLEPAGTLDLGVLTLTPGGACAGVVRDSAGRALPGVDVGVELLGFWWERNTQTDDTGTFRLEHLPSGAGRFVVTHEGYSPWYEEWDDLGRERRRDLVLTRPGSVLVEVADPDGRPRSGLRVEALFLEDVALPSSLQSLRATSDEAGRCQLTLRAGRHRIRVMGQDAVPPQEVTVGEAGEASVRLVVAD